MRFIMSLIALAALGFVSSAFAQEESPSPSGREKPSATVEDKPAATASPEESKAAKKEEPAAGKKESPAAQKKETTAAAATSGKKMSTEGALKDMENKWEAAYASHDASVVQS